MSLVSINIEGEDLNKSLKRLKFWNKCKQLPKIFGKLEYRFIWMGLGLSIRPVHVNVHEQLVPECGRKRGRT